ncbi:MAG: sulfotransferase [Limisphaerales bacterium]
MKPLLITGSHRSGKTWVSRCLMLSRNFSLIHEPFSNYRGPNHQSKLIPALRYTYTHIDESNAAQFKDDVRDIFHYPTYCVRLAKDRGMNIQDGLKLMAKLSLGILKGKKCPLIDSPFLFFSADWMHLSFDARVIVMIRNPASFVADCKAAGYGFDFSNLLNQKQLMTGKLALFAEEIERASQPGAVSLVSSNALLWKLIYHYADVYRQQFPAWMFVRFEDMVGDPIHEVNWLYNKLNLPFDSVVQRRLKNFLLKPDDSGEKFIMTERTMPYPVQKALKPHKSLLTDEEIELVRKITGPVAGRFYQESEWL